MPAKMPIAFIADVPVLVSQLAVGQTGFVLFTDVCVGRDLSTYIRSTAKLGAKTFNSVAVRHTDIGYSLVLQDSTLRFSLREVDDADLIPAESIIVEIEPGLAELYQKIKSEPARSAEPAASPEAQNEQKSQEPQQQAAVMPAYRIAPPLKSLSDLEIDETGHMAFLDVRVDAVTGSTYLEKSARLHGGPNPLCVAVTRRSDGYYLTLGDKSVHFQPSIIRDHSRLFPALKIAESLP
jgi:hypothetical protein